MRCNEARTLLQQRYDAEQAREGVLARHLVGCTACARFAAFLDGLGGELRGTLDAAAAGMPRPDYAAAFAEAAQAHDRSRLTARRLRVSLAAAAAVLVAGVGITGGVRAWVGHRDQALVAAQVSGFVDRLFAEPLLADARVPGERYGAGLRAWLEDPGASFLP